MGIEISDDPSVIISERGINYLLIHFMGLVQPEGQKEMLLKTVLQEVDPAQLHLVRQHPHDLNYSIKNLLSPVGSLSSVQLALSLLCSLSFSRIQNG